MRLFRNPKLALATAVVTAVRRGARGKLQVRDLGTGLLLDHAEAVPHLRRLEKLNSRLHNLV